MSEDRRGKSHRTEWEEAATFDDVEAGIRVRLMRLPLRTPVYSFELMSIRDDARTSRFFRPSISAEQYVVRYAAFDVAAMSRLIAQAEARACQETQERLDSQQATAAAKESRPMRGTTDGDDRRVRQTGKTARKREKK